MVISLVVSTNVLQVELEQDYGNETNEDSRNQVPERLGSGDSFSGSFYGGRNRPSCSHPPARALFEVPSHLVVDGEVI